MAGYDFGDDSFYRTPHAMLAIQKPIFIAWKHHKITAWGVLVGRCYRNTKILNANKCQDYVNFRSDVRSVSNILWIFAWISECVFLLKAKERVIKQN